MASENALPYKKNQATSQTSDCGNDLIPINIGCQNTGSEIQGNENAAETCIFVRLLFMPL